MTGEEQYLRLLGISETAPSLALLTKIVNRHLHSVPYENISKLVRFHEVGPSIPSFEEFVAGIAECTYGGTCFAQNLHLNRLLNHLRFNSKPVANWRDGSLAHTSLRVELDRANYLVDVGIMSSVAGPFRIHPDHGFDIWVGNQRFVFLPSEDLENCRIEIHRDGKMIRSFETSNVPVTDDELEAGIRKTFDPGSMFTTTLCVHRVFQGYSMGVWNNKVYRIEGTKHHAREIRNIDELKEAFERELHLPNYPLELALDLLQRNGAPRLF